MQARCIPLPFVNRPVFNAVLIAVLAICQALPAVADDDPTRTAFPSDLAFNRGIYNTQKLKDATSQGIADTTNVRNDHSDVRHLWIQVLENSRQNATEQTTLFVFSTSVFHNTLTGSRVLQKVRLEYVVLDANGKPAFGESEILEIEEKYDESQKMLYWQCSRLKGQPIRKFYSGLPEWARGKLCQASGFLKGNPGWPLVAYAPSDAESFLGVLDVALSIAPGVAKSVAGKIVEKVVKKASLEGLKDALRDKSIRTGFGPDISHERAIEFDDKFREEGRTIWAPSDK